ncbi:RIO1 family regulatory kinase/ATPase domain-containing protein [Nitratifractor sp.]
MTKTLEEAALEASATHPKREVFPFEHAGERLWLKRARPTGSNLLHHLAWRATRLPLLLPAATQSPAEALRHESGKLRRLESRGVSVPAVLLVTEEFFVMEESGPSLRSLLREDALEKKADEIYRELFETLGRLHALGEYHGGSQLRNFTWKEGRIHFIDFEENFPEETPLESLQFRDLFLLLFSLAKDRHPIDYRRMVSHYSEASGNDWAADRLREFASGMPTLERIVSFPPVWNVLDKDSKATYRLIQELKEL